MRTAVCDPITLSTLCWVYIYHERKVFIQATEKVTPTKIKNRKKFRCEYKRWEDENIKSNILIALPHSQLLTGFYFSTFFLLLWFFEWISTIYLKVRYDSKKFDKEAKLKISNVEDAFSGRKGFIHWSDILNANNCLNSY